MRHKHTVNQVFEERKHNRKTLAIRLAVGIIATAAIALLVTRKYRKDGDKAYSPYDYDAGREWTEGLDFYI